jgi:hypothetical protein
MINFAITADLPADGTLYYARLDVLSSSARRYIQRIMSISPRVADMVSIISLRKDSICGGAATCVATLDESCDMDNGWQMLKFASELSHMGSDVNCETPR